MIGSVIVEHVRDLLEAALITDIPDGDPARAGIVMTGDLQGQQDPDVARISVSVFEGDPDAFYSGNLTSMTDKWSDEVAEVECGGGVNWVRRYTVKARCLFTNTKEDKEEARAAASTVLDRIAAAVISDPFTNVADASGEYVSRPAVYTSLRSEMLQSGGPPDAYDFFIKVRFDVRTTAYITEPGDGGNPDPS